MRTRLLEIRLGTLLAALLSCASCGDSSGPTPDITAPHVDLVMSLSLTGDWCPALVSFRVNPMGSSDNETDRDDLRIRWDFDNDGAWDTDFDTIALQDGVALEPLPVAIWTVRCEVQDRAGNASIYSESLALPDWLPVAPDIIAGVVKAWLTRTSAAPVDTLPLNCDFLIAAKRRDWVAPAGQKFQTTYYIDDTLVAQQNSTATYPYPQTCICPSVIVSGGIGTPGVHEIRVVFDADDAIAESDEHNNVAVHEVFVRE